VLDISQCHSTVTINKLVAELIIKSRTHGNYECGLILNEPVLISGQWYNVYIKTYVKLDILNPTGNINVPFV